MNEKELVEIKNEKVEAMENIVNIAKEEKRAITDEEKASFDELEKEVTEIDNTIEVQNKLKKLDMMKVEEEKMEEVKVEDLERKSFENVVRGIVNADDPTTRADGLVTIPTTIANKIIDKVVEISPVFAMSERYNVKGKLSIPYVDGANSSLKMTYATEGTDVEATNVELLSIDLDEYLGSCLALVSKSLINNSKFDIVEFVIEKMSVEVAKFIEKEILVGTSGKIEGCRGVTLSITTASKSAITSDELIDLQAQVIDNYQANAIWVMNRETRTAISKLKDKNDNYLLIRDLNAKWGYTLLGKDVYTSDNMEKLGKVSTNVAFYGDFSGIASKVSEDVNVQILRENYATKHMDGILTFVGMDAKVQNTQKIAKLVTSAS